MILNSPYISGSLTVTGNITACGGITISGSVASASYASNASFLNGSGSGEFVPTGSFNTFSSSILTYTGSVNSRLSSLETTSGSNITRIGALEVASGSAQTQLTSLQVQTGSYATTGSNTFVGGQYLSSSFNPTGFSTTASLYTDGGLRVTRDAYISGTLYLNNVTVYGTQSVCYITSSQLNIANNLISVNTSTPSVRFGGLAVYDSGSTGLTGSILWDSENNHWVYSNPSGSSYSGGMFISGPRTSTLGSETGTTACMLLAGQGGDHLTSSMIYHSSTVTCIPNTLIGSTVCSTMVNASCIGIGTNSPTRKLTIEGSGVQGATTGASIRLDNTTSGRPAIIDFDDSQNLNFVASTDTGNIRFITGTGAGSEKVRIDASGNLMIGSISAGNAGSINVSIGCAGTTAGGLQLWAANNQNHYIQFGDSTVGGAPYSGYVAYAHATDTLSLGTATATRVTISSTGVACFSGNVCAPSLSICGTFSTTTPLICITGTGTGAYQRVITALNPGMNAGDELMIQMGTALSYVNAGQINFHYEGSGCSTNRVSIGLYQEDDILSITACRTVQIGYAGVPSGTGKLFISRGDQYGLNINAQSGYARIQGDDDLLAINRGGVDVLSISTCNHLGIRTTASPFAALRVCQCANNNDYAVRIQAVFGINDYLDSDANRIFGGGLSETQFLNGSSSRPAMISLGGNLATSEALGVINFFRSDNASTYRSRAQIWAATNGSGCSTTLGGYITFTTADTGQTNPTQKLTIASNGIATFACQVCISGAGAGLTFTGSNNRIYFGACRALEGSTSGTTLQIGENYTTTQIQSAGQIYNGSAGNSPKLYFGAETDSSPGAKAIYLESYWMIIQPHTNEGLRFRAVNASGTQYTIAKMYGTGTFSLDQYSNGTLSVSGGVVVSSSDKCMKIDDGGIDTALSKIMCLNPRYFYWKPETCLNSCDRQLGFYAQDVSEVLGTEVANQSHNCSWGIYDRGIIAMLTKGMQEQQCTINALKTCLGIA